MHHHKTYMYIDFQQNRVNRSVITANTNVFAKKSKLHKRRTDERTDRRRVRQQSVVFSKKNYQKQMHVSRCMLCNLSSAIVTSRRLIM